MEILMPYLKPALFAFFVTFFATKLAIYYFPRVGLMDRPHLYGHKRDPIPYYGGIVLYFSFILSILLFVPMTEEVVALIVGASIVSLLGFLDDLLRLTPLFRIFVQFLAVVVLITAGIGILSINLPFFGSLDLTTIEFLDFEVLSVLFTIFWVLAILNTMNFVDGISGLNSGVTFIASLTMFFLSIHPGIHENPESQTLVATISIIIALIAFAFLIFDFPKPKILMGDSGSTLFGFLLATLAIFSGGKVATAFLVLGIPILDMVWVVLRRIWTGQKFWQGDLKHLHHRLLDIGFGERKVVFIYLAVTAVLGASSVLLASSQQKFFMIVALVILMVVLAFSLAVLPRRRRSRQK